jgi:tRNA-dihydrouridine synthase C
MKTQIIFAPMEGITDASVRALMTERGGFDACVTYFFRVTDHPIPPHVFLRHAPELKHDCKTPSGTPVWIQLLGGKPDQMAESARIAAELGAKNIDLNFGCPAPTVNRNDGGATILRFPQRLEDIVRAVRQALPSDVTVSAKLRLGWDDPSIIDENAKRAEQGGAAWIAIHGRTRMDGYKPPAYWEPIGRVKRAVSIPVIANGEIWDQRDYQRCVEETAADAVMLGRGALTNPNLAQLCKDSRLTDQDFPALQLHSTWADFFSRFETIHRNNVDAWYSAAFSSRLKGWLRYAKGRNHISWWDEVKVQADVLQYLRQHASGTPI